MASFKLLALATALLAAVAHAASSLTCASADPSSCTSTPVVKTVVTTGACTQIDGGPTAYYKGSATSVTVYLLDSTCSDKSKLISLNVNEKPAQFSVLGTPAGFYYYQGAKIGI